MATRIFLGFFSLLPGKMIQFEEHIFQMGLFKKWEDVFVHVAWRVKMVLSCYFTQLAVLTTLLKINMAPEQPFVRGKSSSQPSFVGGYDVSFRECNQLESQWPFLGGGNSNIFDVHPYLGKWSNLTFIFFRRVDIQVVFFGWHLLELKPPWDPCLVYLPLFTVT